MQMQLHDDRTAAKRSLHRRPIAYVALEDDTTRARTRDVLQQAGWTVIAKPTAFHLLDAIADLIEGQTASARPGLIVIDARSRGCSGTTLVAGLRELGLEIPTVVVADPDDPISLASAPSVHVVDARAAPEIVARLAARDDLRLRSAR